MAVVSLEGVVAAIRLGRNMTAVEVLGRVDELTDGTVRSIDAAAVAGIAAYRKSQIQAHNH